MQRFGLAHEQLNKSLVEALDQAGHGKTELAKNIIEILEAGADPLIKGNLNTVLTAAIVYGLDELTEYILKKYPTGHAVFSTRDTFIGNTPLSLAIKRGQSDLAVKLMEKKCDVNGRIGNDEFVIYPLHLCAFLLGTSDDNNKEVELVNVIKLMIDNGANLNEKLHWGQTACDVLMLNLQKEDFELYRDNRDYFNYFSGDLYDAADIAIAEVMLEVHKEIASTKENIGQLQAEGSDVSSLNAILLDLEDELCGYVDKKPSITADVRLYIEFQLMIDDFRVENCATLEEIQTYANECADKNPKLKKMAEYFNRKSVYSVYELREKFAGDVPKDFSLMTGLSLTNSWHPYLPYSLVEHCVWHRRKFNRETASLTRNEYFASAPGRAARNELLTIMQPSLSANFKK